MTFGTSVDAELKLDDPKYLNDVIDWFGDDISIMEGKNKKLHIHFKVNEQALVYWALQYGQHIEVVSPKDTREKIKNTLKDIIKRYEM